MKYEAGVIDPWATAAVIAHPSCEKSELALRHAKAFLAVVEAAKKTERLRKKSNDGKEAERAWWRACDAESVAVLALTRVEREVRRAARKVSREMRERRANATCGDGACRYRPAEVTFDGKTVTVMNSRDAHVLADMVAELAALRALADVVKARCDMANPGWAPEIREALAAVEKVKAP